MFKGNFLAAKAFLAVSAFAAVFTFLSSFTLPAKEKIRWITFAELKTQYALAPKPILIDLYTDWCGWCKHMDRTTYSNEKLADYVNAKYYAVKFNAESREEVTFNGKVFRYDAANRTNEIALWLTGGQLSYPTTVFMSAPDAQPAPLPGYLKPQQMEGPLKFFGERANEKGTFIDFNKKLKPEWQN